MHELALLQSVVDAVREHVGDARVVTVRLEVGRLSAVLPDALRFCFDVCAHGTTLEGAQLDIVEIEGRAACSDCGREIELPSVLAPCPCGSFRLRVVAGQELRVKEVEVV
jgi:hydrogenase nickel incorporation protein HypA/HybF